ncbi:MAG: hypothetical protein AAGF26_16765, partial [Cyanobacteria bacterium P01_G01_bin.49]
VSNIFQKKYLDQQENIDLILPLLVRYNCQWLCGNFRNFFRHFSNLPEFGFDHPVIIGQGRRI